MKRLYVIAAFLISSDIFLVWRIGGFTFRASLLLLAAIVAIGMIKVLLSLEPLVWPVGFPALACWALLNYLFILNGRSLSRNLGYAALMLFLIVFVFVTVQQFKDEQGMRSMLRWYVLSYCASAILGIIQFAAAFVGLTPPLVTQWWSPETMARANGMTYEPSYYATYMICGWVMIDYLRIRRSGLLSVKQFGIAFILTTLALIVCSSRLGWAMMAAWFLLRVFWCLRERNFKAVRRATLIAAGAGIVLFGILSGPGDFLLQGLGLNENQGDFSIVERKRDFADTVRVFERHPIIGVGLGGIGPEIAWMRHSPQSDSDGEFRIEGQCTTMEILAGTGIFGFIFYAVYLLKLFVAPFRLTTSSVELKGLAWGLIFLIAILQFNQSILRLYVWFHIALLSAAYAATRTHDEALRAKA